MQAELDAKKKAKKKKDSTSKDNKGKRKRGKRTPAVVLDPAGANDGVTRQDIDDYFAEGHAVRSFIGSEIRASTPRFTELSV